MSLVPSADLGPHLMDHIPFWSDQFGHEALSVPYLCNRRFQYDDLGFHSYPSRAGVDVIVLFNDPLPLTPTRLENLGAFMQAWVWYGLLGEALRVGSRDTTAPKRIDSTEFSKTIHGCRFLSTKHLMRYIRDFDHLGSPLYQDWHAKRLNSCIQTSAAFISQALDSKYVHPDRELDESDRSHQTVVHCLLACQILCETLMDAFGAAIARSRFPVPAEPQRLDIVDEFLRKSGWCPRRVRSLPKSVCFRYYLSFYQGGTRCSELNEGTQQPECICPQEDKMRSSPKHTLNGCRCPFVMAEIPPFEAHVQERKITLFRFRRRPWGRRHLESRTVDAADELAKMSYIAISHVNSTGLGNVHSTSLPYCQVLLIQSLVDDLASRSCRADVDGTFFWIDTLCLPIDPELRHAALVPARRIFATAQAVLVLDPPLYKHAVNSSQEALVRIRYSSWKGRLWTLEEGLVARSLFFRFSNRTVTLEELLKGIEQEEDGLLLKKVVHVTRPWMLTHFTPEAEALPEMMERFQDDMSTLWKKGGGLPDVAFVTGLSKARLNKIMRLCFLSSPIFRYFVEEDEYQRVPVAWEALIRIYGFNGMAQTQPSRVGRRDMVDDVIERLKNISSIDI